MRKISAKQNILEFLQSNQGIYHGGDLQRRDFKNKNGSNATGDTIKRRLNELVKEGKIFVDYKNGEAHFSAEYSPKLKTQVIEREGKFYKIQVPA